MEPSACRKIIDTLDWERTLVGPRSTWSTMFRVALDIAMQSQFPIMIYWGRDLVQIYNEAYVSIIGERHPGVFGQPLRTGRPDVWNAIGPQLLRAFDMGEGFQTEDRLSTPGRNGAAQVAYFTSSFSGFGTQTERGVIAHVVETLKSVVCDLDFQAMADALAHVVYTHLPDGSVDWTNSRWLEYSKLPPEIARRPEGWAQVLHPDDFVNFSVALERALRTGEPYEVEMRIKPCGSPDSAFRWHLVRAAPVRVLNATIQRWVGSTTDVHDIRLAQERIRMGLESDLAREHETSLAFQRAALPKLPKKFAASAGRRF